MVMRGDTTGCDDKQAEISGWSENFLCFFFALIVQGQIIA